MSRGTHETSCVAFWQRGWSHCQGFEGERRPLPRSGRSGWWSLSQDWSRSLCSVGAQEADGPHCWGTSLPSEPSHQMSGWGQMYEENLSVKEKSLHPSTPPRPPNYNYNYNNLTDHRISSSKSSVNWRASKEKEKSNFIFSWLRWSILLRCIFLQKVFTFSAMVAHSITN